MTEGQMDHTKHSLDLANSLAKEIDPRKNDAILAELDPDNTLKLAGGGVFRLTVVGLQGRSFKAGVQMMLTDRETTIDDVLDMAKSKKK